jgi:hypothetical protein
MLGSPVNIFRTPWKSMGFDQMAIEKVDLPINSMVIFHSFL